MNAIHPLAGQCIALLRHIPLHAALLLIRKDWQLWLRAAPPVIKRQGFSQRIERPLERNIHTMAQIEVTALQLAFGIGLAQLQHHFSSAQRTAIDIDRRSLHRSGRKNKKGQHPMTPAFAE